MARASGPQPNIREMSGEHAMNTAATAATIAMPMRTPDLVYCSARSIRRAPRQYPTIGVSTMFRLISG